MIMQDDGDEEEKPNEEEKKIGDGVGEGTEDEG